MFIWFSKLDYLVIIITTYILHLGPLHCRALLKIVLKTRCIGIIYALASLRGPCGASPSERGRGATRTRTAPQRIIRKERLPFYPERGDFSSDATPFFLLPPHFFKTPPLFLLYAAARAVKFPPALTRRFSFGNSLRGLPNGKILFFFASLLLSP